jgi:hypothetical protein
MSNTTTLSPEIQKTKEKLEELTQSFDGWTAVPENKDSDSIKAFHYRDTVEIVRCCLANTPTPIYDLRNFWTGVPVTDAPSDLLESFFQRLETLAIEKARNDFLSLTK